MEVKKMEKKEKIENFILIFLISIIFLSYFFGFYFDENSAGGGKGDFLNHTSKNLRLFNNNDLFDAFKIAVTDSSSEMFQSSRIPGFYIFNKLLNPFTDNPLYFRMSILFLSLLVPIIFYLALCLKFKNIKKIYLFFLSTLILLSPYFRTSAIWGNEENLAYLAFVTSYFFILKYLDIRSDRRNFFLILVIFFSSLCVYFDQKFTIIPAICFLMIYLNEKRLKNKILVILLYSLFAVPVLYLIYIWGGFLPPMDQIGRDVHLGKYNFQNLGYAITIISFYLAPFIVCLLLNKDEKRIINLNNKNDIYIYGLSICYIIFFLFFYDISNEILLGKGVVYKFAILITDNNLFQKFLISISILVAVVFILKFFENTLINYLIIFFLILTPILYKPILQEYFDPLILLLIFTFFKTRFKINFKNLMVLFIYFTLFLSFTNIYYSKNF